MDNLIVWFVISVLMLHGLSACQSEPRRSVAVMTQGVFSEDDAFCLNKANNAVFPNKKSETNVPSISKNKGTGKDICITPAMRKRIYADCMSVKGWSEQGIRNQINSLKVN